MNDLFSPASITIAEVLEELRRELEMRRRMYPRWVAAKTLSAKAAERQTARLARAIELLEGVGEPT